MKNMLLLFTIASLVFVGCDHKEPSGITNQDALVDRLNQFIPAGTYATKMNMLTNFRSEASNYSKMLKMYFESKPVGQARYEMETTLNSFYAGVSEDAPTVYSIDTLFFTIQNDFILSDGEPVLNGLSLYEAYISLEAYVVLINSSASPTSLVDLELTGFSQTNSNFTACITRQTGNYTGLPVVLKPWETPEPFVNEWYFAFQNGIYEGADKKIQSKLNAHRQSFGNDLIVELLDQPKYESWTTNWDPKWWHGYSNTQLTTNQLNQYLANYKGVLDSWQTPYGHNDIYIHQIWVQSFNGWTACENPPCFSSPPNSSIYCWHNMVGNRVRFIYQEPQTP